MAPSGRLCEKISKNLNQLRPPRHRVRQPTTAKTCRDHCPVKMRSNVINVLRQCQLSTHASQASEMGDSIHFRAVLNDGFG